MALAQQIIGDLTVTGSITASSLTGGVDRSNITKTLLNMYPLPVMDFRVWDAFQTLIATAGTDDLGVSAGVWGTGTPYVQSSDGKATTITQYARTMFTLPPEYVSGDSMTLRVYAGMLTTVSDTTATVDAEVFAVGASTLISGTDLVTTSATTINSLTFANVDFTMTPTGRAAGDVLDIRLRIAITDGATVTVVRGAISKAQLLLTIRG